MSEESDFSWLFFLLKCLAILIALGYVKKFYWEFRFRSNSDVLEPPVEMSCQSDIEPRFDALIKGFENKALSYYVYVVASRQGLLGQLEDQLQKFYPREFSRPFIDYRSAFTLGETSAFMPFVRKRLAILPEPANASSDERSRFEQCLLEQAEKEAERIVQEYAKR